MKVALTLKHIRGHRMQSLALFTQILKYSTIIASSIRDYDLVYDRSSLYSFFPLSSFVTFDIVVSCITKFDNNKLKLKTCIKGIIKIQMNSFLPFLK